MIKSMIQSQPKLRKRGGNKGGLRITGLQRWIIGLAVLLLIYGIRMITMPVKNDPNIDPLNTIKKGDLEADMNVDTPSSFQDVKAHHKATSHLLGVLRISGMHQDMKKRMEKTQEKTAGRLRRVGIIAKVNPGFQGDEPINLGGTLPGGPEQSPRVRGAQPLAH